MIDDDFDIKIINYFKESKNVPQKTIDSIYNVNLSKKKISVFISIQKIIITLISLIAVSTSLVFANDIAEFVKSLFNDSEAVDTAVENGYIYEVPETIYSESQNTKTRIKQMIMDDYTLDLSMMIELDENTNITGFDKIKFPDIIITDDMNNILYYDNIEIFKQYCQENNIDFTSNLSNEKIINTSASFFISSADTNYVHYNCNLSASDTKFPKSKNIIVQFNTIEISNSMTNTQYIISGEWENIITVPNEFYNRNTTVYRCISCNNDKVYKDSIKCEITETGTKFEMSMLWGDYKTEKENSEKIRQKNVLDSLLIKDNAYIENENGNIFYISKSSDSDGGYGIGYDNKLKYWQTFNLTKFDLTESIKIILTTIYNEKIIFELSH